MTIEDLPNILFMDDDLIQLGYSDLAENAVERTLKELQIKVKDSKKQIKK